MRKSTSIAIRTLCAVLWKGPRQKNGSARLGSVAAAAADMRPEARGPRSKLSFFQLAENGRLGEGFVLQFAAFRGQMLCFLMCCLKTLLRNTVKNKVKHSRFGTGEPNCIILCFQKAAI